MRGGKSLMGYAGNVPAQAAGALRFDTQQQVSVIQR
jgi:hypothetical protein